MFIANYPFKINAIVDVVSLTTRFSTHFLNIIIILRICWTVVRKKLWVWACKSIGKNNNNEGWKRKNEKATKATTYLLFIYLLFIYSFIYKDLQILLEKFLCCKNLQLLQRSLQQHSFSIILQNRDRITIENAAKTD